MWTDSSQVDIITNTDQFSEKLSGRSVKWNKIHTNEYCLQFALATSSGDLCMCLEERSTISFTHSKHTNDHLPRTHLQDLHACNLKIAQFELLKNFPPPIPLIKQQFTIFQNW